MKVYIEYSLFLEKVLVKDDPYPIKQEWIEETQSLIPLFRGVWNQDSDLLLGELEKITGKGFVRKELTASVVPWSVPSFSSPVVIGSRRFCRSYMKDLVQGSLDFVDLLFHELLHVFIDQDEEWKKENVYDAFPDLEPMMQEHLHLMVLQKVIYKNLGFDERLDRIENSYLNPPGSSYEKCWNYISNNNSVFQKIMDSFTSG